MEERKPRELTAEEVALTRAGSAKVERESAPTQEPPKPTSNGAAAPDAGPVAPASGEPARPKRSR